MKLIEASSKPTCSLVYQFNGEKTTGTITVTNVKPFPQEWKLNFDLNQKLLLYDEFKVMINTIQQEITKRDGTWLLSIFPPLNEYLLSFCKKLGFKHYFQKRNYVLDLTDFSQPVQLPNNIHIYHWQQYTRNTPLELKDLYQVEYESDYEIRNTGRWDMYQPDPQEFVQRFAKKEADEKTIFIAIHSNKIVGLTYAWTEKGKAGIFFTGVIPKYWNQGIGTALKVALAMYLKEHGYKKLETNNRTANAAILKTNEKLGFYLDSTIEYYRKRVDSY